MNKTKRNLVIASIILEAISFVANLTLIIMAIVSPTIKVTTLDVIFEFTTLAGQIAVIVLLTIAVWGWGKHFNSRRGLYTAAIIISVCLDTFSLVTILLVISLFTSEVVWVKPVDDVYFGQDENVEKVDDKTEVIRDDDVEKKIAALRAKLDKGEITEEQFKEELFKLL